MNIKELNLKWLRSHIGVVSQEPVLFDTTIAGNIRYGKEDATMEEIQEAAKEANAHDFITSLPDGYDSLVGEGGELLSGGQKQRITIARALLRNPSILLLDEATSSLDSQSERLIQNALNAACQGRTTIIIAHRLSTIRDADVIVAIGGGSVAEMGTHSELMAQQGIYHDLVKAQTIADQIPKEEIERYTRQRSRSSTIRKKSRRSSTVRSWARSVGRATITLSLQGVTRQHSTSVSLKRPSVSRRRTLSSEPRGLSNKQSVSESEQDQAIEMAAVDNDQTDGAAETTPPIRRHHRSKAGSHLDATASAVEVEPKVAKYPELIDEEDEEANLPDVSTREILRINKQMWCPIAVGTVAALVAGMVWPAMAIVFGEVLNVFSLPSNEVLDNTHRWGATYIALGIVASVSVLIKVSFHVSLWRGEGEGGRGREGEGEREREREKEYLFCLFQNLFFNISGESLTSCVRSLLFKAFLRQEVGWFDNVKNNTAALTNRLSYDAGEVQGVRRGDDPVISDHTPHSQNHLFIFRLQASDLVPWWSR